MMKRFINVKLVGADPMTREAYNALRGWDLPADENGNDEGFLKDNGKGHLQWDPIATFRRESLPVDGENTITQADVDRMIANTFVKTIGNKTTFMQVTLRNGFTLEETSSCVDPANYSEELGADLCLGKIKDKIWFLLGFLLQSALYGFDCKEGGK